MTVDAPESDSELEEHSAVEVDGTVHALAGTQDDRNESLGTECGLPGPFMENVEGRKDFETSDMCPVCWPEFS